MDIVLCLWSEHYGGGDKSDDRCNEKGTSLVRTVIGQGGGSKGEEGWYR